MTVRRPLHKLDLPYQLRSHPPALLHLLRRQSLPPAPAAYLRQVGERAGRDRQPTGQLEQLLAGRRCEPVARATGVEECDALVVAEYHGVERLGAQRVSGEDEWLASVYPHLHPSAAPVPRFVPAVPALGKQEVFGGPKIDICKRAADRG